jgi:deazaflavin-dependent oxidoreductase (nitroreductase family)
MSKLAQHRPQGFLRWALHAPRWLYHVGLGWLLDDRFLMLTYTGRRSGLLRETIIEVVNHNKESNTSYVASGWGAKSDWFQSIRTNPEVKIQVGRRKINARAEVLNPEDAARQLSAYAREHPTAFHELSTLLAGKALKGTDEECRELAESIPVIAFCTEDSHA